MSFLSLIVAGSGLFGGFGVGVRPPSGGVGESHPQEAPQQVVLQEGPRVRLGLQRRALPFEIRFPALPRIPDRGSLPEVVAPPATPLLSGRRRLFQPIATESGGEMGAGLLSGPSSVTFFPPGSLIILGGPGLDVGRAPGSPSLLQSEFAEIDLTLRGRGELGGDWTRFQPCEVGLQRSCDPGLFPQLEPDIQFGLQVSGTVADRIHIDVDYDEAREFSAVNNVNLYYQGEEGDFLRRVEVGDVTLAFPESRFLTRGIPAGNFGLRAISQVGPLDIQTVWAQQNGDISSRDFQLSGVGDRQAFIQEDTLTLDDADFVRGQFFFLVDPEALPEYPHLDILSLDPGAAPPAVAPGPDPIQLYRLESDPLTRQQVEGYIQATAEAERDGQVVTESGWFRYLQPGVDYLLHPSGLWVALRRPLREQEMLAVTYVTATGEEVGDYDPETIYNQGGRPVLRLLKASGPKHQPGSPTWEQEMHHIYRISSSDDVEASSVALSLSLGELSAGRTFKRRPTGEEITLLKLMGLDEEAPIDEMDPSFILRPAQDFFQDPPPVSGTFIVFPTLRPFAAPPPVPSLGLTAQETMEILGADANPKIYDSVDPVERENSGLYRLTIPFRIRSEGVISSFSLGALGIRDGSERILFGERVLRAGEDYVIDYDIGQVTLLNPEILFSSDPDARIRATWEQKALFQIAPTSIFGFNARYGLGARGAVHLLGLYQKEQTLQNRPQLGREPASIFLGGLNGDLTFGASWLDRLAEGLPGLGASDSASVRIRGEMAVSLPDPNTEGDVYLDDFDSSEERNLSLRARDWDLGSAPEDTEGFGELLDQFPAAENAAGMVWQDTWILEGMHGDSVGVFEGFFPRRDIDEQINIAGTERRETGLRLTFGAGGGVEIPPGTAGWRSITTVLSTTGTDLTRTDYLEFYASAGEDLTLVLDLGRVSEDAFFVDSQGRTSGTRPGDGEEWGLGFLDQEADPRKGEIWNDQLDAQGVWVEECEGDRGRIFPLGDPRANCTRSNGRNDTEDLDGDGNLFPEDRVYRYVVSLDGSSPYLVRTAEETGTSFRLYRVPLRGPDAINVGGRVTEADWRAVKHLRVTAVGIGANRGVSLTRLRLLGSRWIKRGTEGILDGLAGDLAGMGGKVEVAPVSALSEGGGYKPPPGVEEEVDDPTQAYGGTGVEFNEKSLALEVTGLGGGERAEVYSRFPQRPRNFLTYRQLRIWVLGRAGSWGMGEGEFFLKVGTDANNFYLFRTQRPDPPAGAAVASGDWLPEVVVDFEEWLDLRRAAEEALIQTPLLPGDPPLQIWNADSTYAVVLQDRARAPNLAAVRELAVGVWNPGVAPINSTLWINELRLDRPLRDPGYAGYLDVELNAPDLFRTSLSDSGRGPFFRQLSADPTFQGDASLALHSSVDLGRVVPEAWGISVPVTFSHTDLTQDPTFLAQSDLRVDQLQNLRETAAKETRFEVGIRRTRPIGNPILDPVLEGLSLRAGFSRTSVSTTTLEARGSGMDARAEYSNRIEPREVALVPDFAEGLVRVLLPRAWEESLLEARLRWTPDLLTMGTLFSRRNRRSFRYEQILSRPEDAEVVPTLSPVKVLETTARVNFRPLNPVTAEISFFSIRDLLSPEEAVKDPRARAALEKERSGLGALDLGWEIRRAIRTRLGLRPSLASWLQTDVTFVSDYTADRNAALVEEFVTGGDTILVLQRNADGNRTNRSTITLDPEALIRSVAPAQVSGEQGEATLIRIFKALDPVYVSRQGGLSARYFREPVDPGAGFQLGWGGRGDLRFMDGDTASVFTGRTSWTGGTGVRFPLGLRLSGNYSQSSTDVLYARSDRELRTRTWPDVRLSLTRTSRADSVDAVLESFSFSSGYRQNTVENTYGGRGVQRRRDQEWQIPVEANATWVGSLSTRYRGVFSRGDGEDPTGQTLTRRENHTVGVSSSFDNAPWLGERLDGPLRLSLQYQYTSELRCRELRSNSGCVSFVDFLNRSINLTLDTILSSLEVGLHFTYTSRRSFVGQREGSTQFQLGLFGEFLFDGGGFGPPSSSMLPAGVGG